MLFLEIQFFRMHKVPVHMDPVVFHLKKVKKQSGNSVLCINLGDLSEGRSTKCS